MGDYAITKVILGVKQQYQEKLKSFIGIEKTLQFKDVEAYETFWKSMDVDPFYYMSYPFSAGSLHTYSTSLGTSDDHKGSYFYIDDKFTTRFEDGFWFVEFSSKMKEHRHFIDNVVPLIADSWIALYGDEYHNTAEKIEHNPYLIHSDLTLTQSLITNFTEEYNDNHETKESCDSWGWY